MMKETKKSLKIYFIIIGVLGILSGIKSIAINSDILIKFFGIVTLVFAIIFFYYGIKLYDYLQNSPRTLINFVIVALTIPTLLRLINGQFVYVVGAILLGWYLIHNIKKLSIQTNTIENKK